MDDTKLLALAGTVVTCATTIYVARQHRRQMRQIELHRAGKANDPLPPPGSIARFWRKSGGLVVGVGSPAIGLIATMLSSGPVTRFQVLSISFSIAAMLFAVILFVVARVVELLEKSHDYSHNAVQQLLRRMEMHLELTGRTIDLVDRAAGSRHD